MIPIALIICLVLLILGLVILMGTTSKTIVVLHTSSQDAVAYLDLTDGTEAELKIVDVPGDTGKSLGDGLTDQVIQAIEGQTATPSDFDKLAIYNNTQGIEYEAEGNITGAMYPAPNVVCENMNLPVRKGYTIKALTSD